jgi:hypothetical protein
MNEGHSETGKIQLNHGWTQSANFIQNIDKLAKTLVKQS